MLGFRLIGNFKERSKKECILSSYEYAFSGPNDFDDLIINFLNTIDINSINKLALNELGKSSIKSLVLNIELKLNKSSVLYSVTFPYDNKIWSNLDNDSINEILQSLKKYEVILKNIKSMKKNTLTLKFINSSKTIVINQIIHDITSNDLNQIITDYIYEGSMWTCLFFDVK